MKMTNNRWC